MWFSKPKSQQDQQERPPNTCAKCGRPLGPIIDTYLDGQNRRYCSDDCYKAVHGLFYATKAPEFPAPIPPAPALEPIKGIMRVDVTQTHKTVDVWIVLSEEAKHIVEQYRLGELPIEQNFDGLKQHIEDFSEDYDSETNRPIERNEHYQDPLRQVIHEQTVELGRELFRHSRQYEKKYELEDEVTRYKAQQTVYLATYLENPYRKIISHPLEAAAYIERLEKEYLPKIKKAIQFAKSQGPQPQDAPPRRYEF